MTLKVVGGDEMGFPQDVIDAYFDGGYFGGEQAAVLSRFSGIEWIPFSNCEFDLELLGLQGEYVQFAASEVQQFRAAFAEVMNHPGVDFRNLEIYEKLFGLEMDTLKKCLAEMKKVCKRDLKVLDTSGKGIAFKEILRLPSVSGGRSIGLTLPCAVNNDSLLRARTLFANMMHMLMAEQGRLDVIMSANGEDIYYPLEFRDSKKERFLRDSGFGTRKVNPAGVLHMIQMLNIGGYIFTSHLNQSDVDLVYGEFIELGILEYDERFDKFAREEDGHPNILRLVRRPNPTEIINILELEF